jgi:hypothetical protein
VSVSTNFSFSPTCDTILRMALQKAGLLGLGRTPSAGELSHARDHLNLSLKSLSAQGASLMQMERKTLPLVAGTGSYALAADTIEVDDTMSVVVTGATGETWVTPIVYQEYQQISNKDQQGTPTQVYVEKLALVSLVFWPVPDQAYTLSYRRQRLIRDMESGTTLDLTQRWYKAVVLDMAAEMSWISSINLGDKQELRRLADQALHLAQGREQEQGDTTYELPSL